MPSAERRTVIAFGLETSRRRNIFALLPNAPLAQLAEQVTLNHWVVGSIPTRCKCLTKRAYKASRCPYSDRLGLIPEYSCAGSDCKVLRTWSVDRPPRDSFRPDVTRLVPESPCRLLHPCIGRFAPSLFFRIGFFRFPDVLGRQQGLRPGH